jgi:hypothetical protein
VKNKILIAIALVVMLSVSAVIVSASTSNPSNVIYSRLDSQGADEIFTIPEYNLVCVYKGNSLSCTCPCGGLPLKNTISNPDVVVPNPDVPTEVPNPDVPTVVPTVVPTSTAVPTSTVVPTEKPNGVFIVHYDADGTQVWAKCMQESSWNGHQSHPGHIIQDLNLGSCIR